MFIIVYSYLLIVYCCLSMFRVLQGTLGYISCSGYLGYSRVLLDIFGYFWVLLGIIGYFWVLLGIIGYFWVLWLLYCIDIESISSWYRIDSVSTLYQYISHGLLFVISRRTRLLPSWACFSMSSCPFNWFRFRYEIKEEWHGFFYHQISALLGLP